MRKNAIVKILAMLVLTVMVISTVAAGGAEESAAAEKIKVAIITDVAGFGDQAYNDAGYAGLMRAAEDFEIEVKAVESPSMAEYETTLDAVAQLGFELIFALSSSISDAVRVVAPRYSDTMFVIIDGNVGDVDNVLSIGYREQESAFLAGALAAKMSRTKKIGFVLGMKIPVLERFEVGYVAGANYADLSVETYTVYTGKFNDPGLGKESAITLFGQGLDIVAAAAGACNLGVFDAAIEKGAGYWAMGAAAGQSHLAPEDIMADQVKRLDNSIYYLVQEYIEEGSIPSGLEIFGLKEGGVGLLYGNNAAGIPDDVFAYIDEISEEIIAGNIAVPTNYEELEAFKSTL